MKNKLAICVICMNLQIYEQKVSEMSRFVDNFFKNDIWNIDWRSEAFKDIQESIKFESKKQSCILGNLWIKSDTSMQLMKEDDFFFCQNQLKSQKYKFWPWFMKIAMSNKKYFFMPWPICSFLISTQLNFYSLMSNKFLYFENESKSKLQYSSKN